MRKHFLILMLLALLPMAGWATITVTADPTVNPTAATYDGSGKTVITVDGTANGVAAADAYEFKYFASTGAVPSTDVSDWKDKDHLTVTTAGTYHVWYIVESPVENEDTYGPVLLASTFTVNKADLTQTTAPAKISGITFDGASHELITAGEYEDGTIEYQVNNGGWSGNIPVGTAAGNYIVKFRVTAADQTNYNNVNATVIAGTGITAKTLANNAHYTIEVSNNTKKYTGRTQTATISIIDKDLNNAPLVADEDFEVKYYDGVTPVDEPKDAKEYTIKVEGKGNYQTAAAIELTQSWILILL